jgi:hypothetical protein
VSDIKTTKVLTVDYDSEGNGKVIKEEVINPNQPVDIEYDFLESLTVRSLPGGDRVRMTLREAFLNNPDAANILRTDLKQVAFTAMANASRTYTAFTREIDSRKQQEEYIRDAGIGVIPKYRSGQERPRVASGFEGGTIVRNDQYSVLVDILGDWIRFDQIGKIRQIAEELGLAAILTDEYEAYKAITDTANYNRSDSTDDNDVGANTQTLTFSADGFRTAKAVVTTAKDRKSGAYLGYNPNLLFATPLMEVPVLQLLTSTELQRTHGNTTVETIGTGTSNPLRGMIQTIVFSPWVGQTYEWGIMDTSRGGFVRQNVEGWNIYQETMTESSESFLTRDVIRYMISGYFGLGFIDDRCAFYSDSTTEPSVS